MVNGPAVNCFRGEPGPSSPVLQRLDQTEKINQRFVHNNYGEPQSTNKSKMYVIRTSEGKSYTIRKMPRGSELFLANDYGEIGGELAFAMEAAMRARPLPLLRKK